MKKRFIYLVIVFVLLLTSCSFAQENGVTLSIENNVFPVGTKSVVAKWTNNTNDVISFGFGFKLEQKEKVEWVEIEHSKDYIVEDVLATLLPKGETEAQYNILAYYGKDLPKGEYRIKANYSFDDDKEYGEKDYYIAFAEFEIK